MADNKIQIGKDIVVIPVNMENRSIEDIAREAALRIIEATDSMAKQRKMEKKERSHSDEL
ncbi:MAG: hypothetical protein E7295_11335 [Lachnospiraceae bacterium]|nr:hypothetical protein [Lachnospiraceae bacterium]